MWPLGENVSQVLFLGDVERPYVFVLLVRRIFQHLRNNREILRPHGVTRLVVYDALQRRGVIAEQRGVVIVEPHGSQVTCERSHLPHTCVGGDGLRSSGGISHHRLLLGGPVNGASVDPQPDARPRFTIGFVAGKIRNR